MLILLAFLFVIVWLCCVYFSGKSNGQYYNTYFIFGLAGFVYFISVPLYLALSGVDFYVTGNLSVHIPYDIKFKIILMALLAYFGFVFGNYFASKIRFIDRDRQSMGRGPFFNRDVMLKLYTSVFMFAFLLIFVFYRHDLFAMSSYSASYHARYLNSTLSYLITIVSIFGALLSADLLSRNMIFKMLGVLTLLFVIFLGVFLSYKIVLLPAALVIVYHALKHISFRWLLLFTFIIVPLVLYLALFFSFYRGSHEFLYSLEMSLIHFNILSTDPAGPIGVLAVSLTRAPFPHLGITYLSSLTQLVPRFIWHSRPDSLSVIFAREILGSSWVEGQGFGYSPLVEAYYNFWIMGAFIQYFIFGFLWQFIWSFIRENFFVEIKMFRIFFCIVGYYILILSFRSSFIFFIKSIIYIFVPFVIAYLFSRRIHLKKG